MVAWQTIRAEVCVEMGKPLQAGPSHPTPGACSTSVVRSLPIVRRAGRRLFQGRNDYATTCTPHCLHMTVQIGLTARPASLIRSKAQITGCEGQAPSRRRVEAGFRISLASFRSAYASGYR